jgi:DNA-binding CsgD family transcriptional regulator
MQVLHCRGTELEREFPFGLVAQLFGPAVRELDEAERGDVLDQAAELAGPIVGIEPAVPGAGEIGDPSFQVLNALLWLTSNLAERTPLFLAVDDAQWADEASLRFLAFLLPRLGDLPVALAVAVRTGEPGANTGLLDQLSSDPTAAVLHPSRLSQGSVADLVRRDLASDASSAFCAACESASGGNPFMLNELLRELRSDRFSGSETDADRVRELAPASIQRSVLARLARLSDEARLLARAVAVLGDDAEVRDAAALARLDTRDAREAVDALGSAGILESGRPLRFSHPLLRNAVYADLSGAERADLHRLAAQQLIGEGFEIERIAVHLLATDPDGEPQVVETLTAAAKRSLARGAPEAAEAYARRALAEPAAPAARPELLRAQLTASYRSMDPEALAGLDTGLLEELTGDRETLYDIASELGPLLLVSGRRDDALALFDRARGAALEADDYDRVISFDAQLAFWAGWNEKQEPDWDLYADRLGEDSPGQRVRLAMKAWSGLRGSEPASNVAQWVTRAARHGSIFRELRDGALLGVPMWTLIRVDELDEAERAFEQFSRGASAIGPAPVIGTIFNRGLMAYARGQIAVSESELRDAVDRGRASVFFTAVPDWTGLLVEVLTERGELDAADRELSIDGMAGALPDKIRFSQVMHARGCLRLAQGKTSEGLDDLTTLSERLERYGWSNPIYSTDAVRAIALAGAGEERAAEEAAEKYSRAAEHWGTPRAKGIALRTQGIVKAGDQGTELLRDAVATLRGSPARLELARALTDLGAALRRANQRAAAREPLREALEIARRGGAVATGQRAHDELEATGEKLRPLMAGGVESLTPSERRVTSLAAQGKTNRAIAQELFLTVKTIEAHLSSAYRKLDIASRSELPEALGEVA